MDLRKEIEELIEKYGHYVLLHRTSRKIRCTCWNEKYQEAESSCPICLGQGWVGRIERHKIRRETATNIISLPDRIGQHSVGQMLTDTRTFYMKHDVLPKEGDIIYEVGWDGNRPTHIVKSYEINYADDMRADNGRIEFFQVSAKEKNNPLKVKNIRTRRLGKLVNYELIRERG